MHCLPSADFLWGAATSAYQVEGSPLADGAGPSDWHFWSHTPGKVLGNHTGDVACDHFRLWRDDIAIMARLGLKAYRFSVAWSRVLPEGRGRLNPRGLDFYSRLVDGLLEAGIEPMVTLHHWDLPWELARKGGWASRETVAAFEEFAAVVFRALRGRVRLWATINEPWVLMDAGFVHGVHPPGLKDPRLAAQVAHHLLLAHARGVELGHALGAGEVGLVVNLEPKYPAIPGEQHGAAAQRAEVYQNQLFLDPLFFGRYPEGVAEAFGGRFFEDLEGELVEVQGRVDFLGVNYYTRSLVLADPQAPPPFVRRVPPPAEQATSMGWEVYSPGLLEVLLAVRSRYGQVPLFVTENGAAFPDPPPRGQRVADPRRVEYLASHLRACLQAVAQGVPLRGYFVWSLLDNFEWSWGFGQRFGIVHVDFATQKRTIKDSGYFYQRVIGSGGAVLFQEHGFPFTETSSP
jgi:beta-glucosidase